MQTTPWMWPRVFIGTHHRWPEVDRSVTISIETISVIDVQEEAVISKL